MYVSLDERVHMNIWTRGCVGVPGREGETRAGPSRQAQPLFRLWSIDWQASATPFRAHLSEQSIATSCRACRPTLPPLHLPPNLGLGVYATLPLFSLLPNFGLRGLGAQRLKTRTCAHAHMHTCAHAHMRTCGQCAALLAYAFRVSA